MKKGKVERVKGTKKEKEKRLMGWRRVVLNITKGYLVKAENNFDNNNSLVL